MTLMGGSAQKVDSAALLRWGIGVVEGDRRERETATGAEQLYEHVFYVRTIQNESHS